jgi:GNAT superfamily N-acetyltransferase
VSSVAIRPLEESDHSWVVALLTEHWGGPVIVTRGRIHAADKLPGFKAVLDTKCIGLLTYRLAADDCEVISLNSLHEGIGVGTKLMTAVRNIADRNGCRRIWLITTNDNARAITFYEKLGYEICAIHAGAVAESRRLKPSIPLVGIDGIEIRDEIEMELVLR